MHGKFYIGLKITLMAASLLLSIHDFLAAEEYHTNIILSGTVNVQDGGSVSGEIVVGKIYVSYIKKKHR